MYKRKILKNSEEKLSEILLFILAVLQILDGVLTYFGVSRHYADEANPIVKYLIEQVGPLFALIIVKSLALLGILILYYQKLHGKIVSFILAVDCVYFFVVLSWILHIFH